MKTRRLFDSIKYGIAASAVAFSLEARAESPEHASDPVLQLATGQYVTPTAPHGAVQQFLNPGLSAYPNFVAGEAVRSQLSPDGRTLAVLYARAELARQARRHDRHGQLDAIHLSLRRERRACGLAGAHAGDPAEERARGSRVLARWRDALRRGRQGRRGLCLCEERRCMVAERNDRARARQQGRRHRCQPERERSRHLCRRQDAGRRQQLQRLDQRDRHDEPHCPLRARPAPVFANNEGSDGGIGGTFPFAVVVKGNNTAYVSSDRNREVVAVDVSSPTAGHLIKRIKLDGNALGMTLDAPGSKLYVAQDNADQVGSHRHRLEHRGREDRCARAGRHACRSQRQRQLDTALLGTSATRVPQPLPSRSRLTATRSTRSTRAPTRSR